MQRPLKMKKPLLEISIIAFGFMSCNAQATLPVVDYSHIAQDAASEVVNLAKWTKTEIDAAETQLNTLNQFESSVTQLARMGDPNQLRNLPGIRTVAELYGTAQQLQYEYQSWQRFLDPSRYQSDLNSILSSYQQPNWNGFTSMDGTRILPNMGQYQFDTARWNIANDAQDQLKKLEQQRQTLEKQRDAELSSIQSAIDQSSV
jgi:hypothetical protein